MTKRGIVISGSGRLVSVLVPKDAGANVHLGTQFLVTSDIDLKPYATVPSGLLVTVVFTDEDSGEVELALDVEVPGLRPWGNAFSLLPFETEEAMACLKLVSVVKLFPLVVTSVLASCPSQEYLQCS